MVQRDRCRGRICGHEQYFRASKDLLRFTWEKEETTVVAALGISHIHVTSNRSYNNMDALQSALEQTRERQYYDSAAHYQRRLLLVGINDNEKDKTHSCRIEEFMK